MKKVKGQTIESRYLEVLKGIKNILDSNDDIYNITNLKSALSSEKISNDIYLVKALNENFSVFSTESGSLKWTGTTPNIKMARKLIDCVKENRKKIPSLNKEQKKTEEEKTISHTVSKSVSGFNIEFSVENINIKMEIQWK